MLSLRGSAEWIIALAIKVRRHAGSAERGHLDDPVAVSAIACGATWI